eukprot:TRINITY_DN10681_c0_g1_i7.p1 TRINITY_DN10681_c0_g1~~TRINITY_DN10681_c0_g1_i7.p1  ORF type:complete len:411 (+),score=65.85 TRINITY_DN10681_c0_g1_i7:663-1895(+)
MDEVAAMIAAARAAVNRPEAANSGSLWEERAVTAAEPTAAKAAVEFGPIGTPPPDADACSGPGWIRDAGVQCGGSTIRSTLDHSSVGTEAPRQGGCFSPARTGGWPSQRPAQSVDEEVQTLLSGNARQPPAQTNSEIRLSICSNPLETVDEDQQDEVDSPLSDRWPVREGLSAYGPFGAIPTKPNGAAPPYRRRLPPGQNSVTHSFVGGPYPHQVAQPTRPGFWNEPSTNSSGRHAMTANGGLCFGRVLDDQHSRCMISPDFSQAPMSARESRQKHQLEELPPALPVSHLHRLCDPMARRPNWLRHSSEGSAPKGRSISPMRSVSSTRVSQPSGLEHRPPEPEATANKPRAAGFKKMQWSSVADARMPWEYSTKKTAVGISKSLKAGAQIYASKNKSHIYSLGFTGGARF